MRSTTPVRVPRAAIDYTPNVQDPDLRSQINAVLLRDGHVAKIQEALSHALHASSTNWPTRVHNHALALLRSGDCVTFPALMERVLADIRRDTESAAAAERGTGAERKDGRTPEPITSNGAAAAAAAASNGRENEPGNIGGSASGDESLAVPRAVVDDGVRVTRECLDLVCEIED